MKKISLIIILFILPFFAYSKQNSQPFLDIINISFLRIDLDGRMGHTGYIDFLTCKDFPEGHSVITFQDKLGRSGFAIRYTTEVLDYKNEETIPKLLSDSNKVKVTALFERHENSNGGVWVTGVINSFPSLTEGVYFNYGAQNSKGIYARHIKELVDNGQLDFQHNSKYFDENHIPLSYNTLYPEETILRTEITIRANLVKSCGVEENKSIEVPKTSNTSSPKHQEL